MQEKPAPAPAAWPWWVATAAWGLLIFVAIPFVRLVTDWIREHLGGAVFGYAVIVLVVAALITTVAILRRARPRPGPGPLLWLGVVASGFVGWTIHLWERPEEAIHFIEYGVIGIFAYRALSIQLAQRRVHLAAALVGILIGTCDEILQWITPDRYWDYRDLVINAGACIMVQLAIRGVMGSDAATAPDRWRSLRLAARLAVAELLLLGLCLANTPSRVEWYAQRVPLLAFLAGNQNAMTEYGYLHEVPGIGRFKSRFTLDELRRLDKRRAKQAAAILDQYRGHAAYGHFLKAFPSGRDPFLHEARVHIFSRNRNLGRARKARDDPGLFGLHRTVAWREHLILESYFGHTLAASKSAFPARRVARLKGHDQADMEFFSKVSAGLVTTVSETQLRILLAVVIFLLLVLDRFLARRKVEPDA